MIASETYLSSSQRIIHLEANQTARFVFTNTIKPSLNLIKLSSDGSWLEGVTFRIAKIEDGSRYLDRTTNAQGEILISDLEPGVYSVRETATLNDHIIDVREYHVELFPGKTSTLVIENQRRPNLTIYKRDADTGEPIPNTVFLVKAADGHSVNEVKTGADGKAILKNLLPGVYEVSEKSVPAPWLTDAPPQLVTLYPNRDRAVYFENHKKPALTINKVDSITGSPIKGAKFEVWYGSNNTTTGELNSLGAFFSDENGQIVIENLRDGWYKVQELEPAAGFTIKEPAVQEFYIKGGESKTITFENVPLNAIILEKYDSVTGEALPGCTFELKYLGGTSGTGGTTIGTKVTGKNGTAMWTGLKPGTYILHEVDPADGYSIIQSSETIFLADSGEQSVVTVRFANAPDGTLLIRKVCATNPSVTLQNAEFKITYADGTLVGDSNGIFRTDEHGEIRITGLKPGKSVIVTEACAPAGFVLDTQSQTVQIKEGKTVSLTFKNQPMGQLIIQKRDSETNKPLPGAEFRITTAAGCEVGLNGVIGTSTLTSNGIFTTDSQGEIKITNLAPGAYILSEIKAPDGYLINTPSTNVVIGTGGDTQTIVIKNSKTSTLVIEKYADTGTSADNAVPLKGVTFLVTDSSGAVVGNSNGEFITGEDGRIVIDGLTPGTTITAREIKTVEGYVLDGQPKSILIKEGEVQTLKFYNKMAGTIVIRKLDKLTGKPLAGVEFELTYAEGGYVDDANGHLSSKGLYTTDEKGEIRISGITGTIVIKETKPLPGYTIDPTTQTQTVTVNPADTQTVTFYNIPGQTLTIQKLVTGTKDQPLAGVEFLITDSSGGFVGPNNGIYKTDKNGCITLTGLEPGTVITAKEAKTLEGFVLDSTPQSIEIKSGVSQTLTFYNTPSGGVEIIKVSETDKSERIPNVTFEIRRVSDQGLVRTVTTDKKGRVYAELDAGNYYAVEIECPKEFKCDSTPHYFTVTDGKNTTLTVTNKPFLLSTNNYAFDLTAVPLMQGEVITDVRLEFGKVPANFASVVKPTLTIKTNANLANGYQVVNRAGSGGRYKSQWETGISTWVTLIVRLNQPSLPKTGF